MSAKKTTSVPSMAMLAARPRLGDRSEALARLRTALRETTVVLDGGTTTKSFPLDLPEPEELISGSADTGWLDRTGAAGSYTHLTLPPIYPH